MTAVDKKIIDAVLAKAQKHCPGAIDLLGVYGSAATGDTHSKSDLDLLIVCDESAVKTLAGAFVLDDISVGYDIYCTPWSRLEEDAKCTHANLAKLLDAKIIFSKDDEAFSRLEELRQQVWTCLESDERFSCADTALSRAKITFAECIIAQSLPQVRLHAAGCISYLFDALMLADGKYFKLGTRRNFTELGFDSEQRDLVLSVVCAKDENALKNSLCDLVRSVISRIPPRTFDAKPAPGTYEEMYSNWKGKMSLAASENDAYTAFMSLASFQFMLSFCAPAGSVGDAMADFDADDLEATLRAFDEKLEEYRALCIASGVEVKHFANVDEFVKAYVG